MTHHKKHPQDSATIEPIMQYSRRSFLQTAVGAAAFASTYSFAQQDISIPKKPVTVQVCKRYHYPTVRQTMSSMFDELGDVRSLVKNKFVTIKLNLVNTSKKTVGGIPVELCVTTHPTVAMAVGSLFVEYGAKKVTFCDQLPFEEIGYPSFSGYGFDEDECNQEMNGRVAFVNTRNLGSYKSYDMVKVPHNPFLTTAWEVNKTYTESDVLISIGKLKNHVSGGVTLGMKNLFGVPPSSLYGDDLENEPDENATGYRGGTMHNCDKQPLTSSTTFTGQSREGEHGYNVPRFIVDLNNAFPIDLVVVDGISTIHSAEGWWLGSMVNVTSPGLLIAGRNPVCTDAAGAAIMGFDPDADDFEQPFSNGSNYLALARKIGLGENRLSEIEVGGIGLEKARFNFQPTYQRPRS